MPRGGARPGAGRPKKASKAGRSKPSTRPALTIVPPAAAASELDVPPPPAPLVMPTGELMKESEQTCWQRWAPQAERLGTLTEGTLPGFVTLCQVGARLAEVAEEIDSHGLTEATEHGLKAHPLLPTYRGLVQRQEMLLQRYQLAAMAKAAQGPQGPIGVPAGGAGGEETTDLAIVRALRAIK